MKTRVVKINRQLPAWAAVNAAARTINMGGIVCFPTDTVYGFAASIYCRRAIERLRAIKERRRGEPFVVIASDVNIVDKMASVVTPGHRRLMNAHWPGPLTIVFPAAPGVPGCLQGAEGTVAVRVPRDMLTQSILRACGVPLAAPSANVRGRRPAVNADDVLAEFEGKIDLLLDGGVIEDQEPSTIVEVAAGRVAILRKGRLSAERVSK
jgi:L-threonylcarbamoyladenylate synthase